MAENNTEKKDFSQIGKIAAIEQLYASGGFKNSGGEIVANGATAHKVLLEGIDFDLVYMPLKHLGYKAALSVLGELYAQFSKPATLSVILGISARFGYNSVEELWEGITAAAKEHGVKQIQLDLNPSLTGLCISLSASGEQKAKVAKAKPDAKTKDLLCLSGNVGAAYMGLHVLEREKSAFVSDPSAKQPDLSKYKYILSSYLSPEIKADTIDRFCEFGIVPTCGAFVTKGLAEAVKRIAAKTGLGAKVYVDRIPIARQTFDMAEEIGIDPLTAALNGGDDFRLLMAIPLEKHEIFHKEFQDYDMIGHLCTSETGTLLVTPEGGEIELKSQGW